MRDGDNLVPGGLDRSCFVDVYMPGGGCDHRLVRPQSRVNHRFICLSSAYQKVDSQIGADAVGAAALFYNQFSRLLTVGVQTVAWILSQIGVYHGL